MDQQTAASPIIVSLLCALRCLVPLLLMLGVSYLLRKLGLIAAPPEAPPETNNGNNHNANGGLAHGKI